MAFVSHPKWHFFLSGLAESFLIVSMIVFYFYSRERDLAEAKARETEAVKAPGPLPGQHEPRVSHALHGILGLLDLASRSGGDATRQRYLAMATDAAHSLQARVRELLDFSSLQTEKVRLVSKPFNLRLMLDSLTSLLAVPAAQKGLNFCAWATEDLPHCLVGDAERLKQVLVNLGANAIKFTPAGEVEIKARLAGQDDQGCLVEFSIADTGMGISQEEGQKIFSPFHRVDDELASEQEGSGLGLAISDELVKAMGGEIKLRSWPGKGSTFFFTLRLAMEQTSQQQPGGGLRASLALQNRKTALAIGHTMANLGVECSASDAEAMAAGRAHGELWFIDGSLAGPVHEAIAQKARNASPPARLVVLREMNSADNGMDLGEKADVLLLPPRYGDLLGLLQEIRQPQGRAATAALQAPEVPVYGKDGRQPLVLVAEDNPISQTIITALLKERGLGVHLAEDGGQAAAMAKERVYDLICLDMRMPNKDGLQVAREIRTGKGHPNAATPMAAISAQAYDSDKQAAREAGLDHFLTKPLDVTELDRMLARHFGTTARQKGWGNGNWREQVRELFLQTYSSDLALLRDSLASGDMERLALLAHRFKSSLVFFADESIMEHAVNLQANAADSNLNQASRDLAGLESGVEQIAESLREAPKPAAACR